MVPTNQSHVRRRRVAGFVTLALLLATAISACAFPEEAFDGSLDGSYYVNGFDQQEVEYSGLLTITTTADPAIYDMQWIITGSVQGGTGTVEGNQLLVEWSALEGYDTTSRGTGVYEISADGELAGERRVDGQEGVGTEEAFPIR
jgi:hypothetical protein